MDWNTQAQEMMQTWINSQKKMWDTFSASMPGFEKAPSQKAWEQMIAFGEETLKNALDAQAEWMRSWSESTAAIPDMPEAASKSMEQFQEMMKRWNETQAQSWRAWFEMLKTFDPARMGGAWTVGAANPFAAWQDTTKKMMDAQLDWMKTWSDQVTKGK